MLWIVGTITLTNRYPVVPCDWRGRGLPSQTFHENRNLDSDMWKLNIFESYRIWSSSTIITRVPPVVIDGGEHLESAENYQERRTKSETSEDWSDSEVRETSI